MSEIKNRIDCVYIFDVQDGNPNGDPDAGNLPRVDAETGMGLVTDVCLKRKVRNYVQMARGNEEGFDIFIKEKAVLNTLIDKAECRSGTWPHSVYICTISRSNSGSRALYNPHGRSYGERSGKTGR